MGDNHSQNTLFTPSHRRRVPLFRRENMPSTGFLFKAAAAAAATAALVYLLRKQLAANGDSPYLPSKAEQAWLDEQIRQQSEGNGEPTPGTTTKLQAQIPDADEQKWLEGQIASAEDSEMLDDARQAAFAPGEGSSPLRPAKRN